MGYTKLFDAIVTSTVWSEPYATRIVWITLLALRDRNHFVATSIPGLAHIARVTVNEAREAIRILSSPDPDSRTKVLEGRRIKEGDGGYFIINGEKYRQKMSVDERREYQRLWLKKKRESKNVDSLVYMPVELSTMSTQTESETKKELVVHDSSVINSTSVVNGDMSRSNERSLSQPVDKSGLDPATKKKIVHEMNQLPSEPAHREVTFKRSRMVLDFLNLKTHRKYRPVPLTLNLIERRLSSGVSVDDCKSIIAKKVREWACKPEMEVYLRPKTLFNATNFEQYLGELKLTNQGGQDGST